MAGLMYEMMFCDSGWCIFQKNGITLAVVYKVISIFACEKKHIHLINLKRQ